MARGPEPPGAQHTFDLVGFPRAASAAEAMERFLGVVYGEWLRTRSTTPTLQNLSGTKPPAPSGVACLARV